MTIRKAKKDQISRRKYPHGSTSWLHIKDIETAFPLAGSIRYYLEYSSTKGTSFKTKEIFSTRDRASRELIRQSEINPTYKYRIVELVYQFNPISSEIAGQNIIIKRTLISQRVIAYHAGTSPL